MDPYYSRAEATHRALHRVVEGAMLSVPNAPDEFTPPSHREFNTAVRLYRDTNLADKTLHAELPGALTPPFVECRTMRTVDTRLHPTFRHHAGLLREAFVLGCDLGIKKEVHH